MTNFSIVRWVGALAFVCAAFVVGCGGDDDGDDGGTATCEDADAAALAAGQQALTARCNTCHASSVTGAARGGAPVGTDFDTREGVDQWADRIKVRAEGGTMPPAGKLPDAELENLLLYVDCGE